MLSGPRVEQMTSRGLLDERFHPPTVGRQGHIYFVLVSGEIWGVRVRHPPRTQKALVLFLHSSSYDVLPKVEAKDVDRTATREVSCLGNHWCVIHTLSFCLNLWT